ncbi:MAG TPA: type II toxin-antitoxin system VapC family toxin [Candidatus Nanoarchaeia archaeon]|nr:type II toxin-antitoxin system VapC family toxin [Candidatus Nanoarchaeia archaeon]
MWIGGLGKLVLLDSDILIALGRKNQDALRKIKELEKRNDSLATTVFSEAELFEGVYGSNDREKTWAEVLTLLQDIPRIPFEDTAPQIAARIFYELKKRGAMIGTVDVFIASIVLAGNDVLITRNKKHFDKIPGLQIEEW